MTKKKFSKSIQFVEINDLKENRFLFVKNEILRENISISMQYVIFLVSLEEEYELPGATTYSVFKTIILYTASIIESLISYRLKQMIKNNVVTNDKIMGKEEKYPEIKELYKISNTEKICGVKKVIMRKKLSDNTMFQELNRAAKKAGLFTYPLFEKAEKLKEIRNRIHLSGLTDIEDKYSKSDIIKVFEIAKSLIVRIETYKSKN